MSLCRMVRGVNSISWHVSYRVCTVLHKVCLLLLCLTPASHPPLQHSGHTVSQASGHTISSMGPSIIHIIYYLPCVGHHRAQLQ
jgi:hypothetical protein